jgi:hypothetical protein
VNAYLLSKNGVVGFDEGDGEEGAGVAGAGLSLERPGVAFWGWGLARLVGEGLEGEEAFWGIWGGFWTEAIW